MAYQDHLVNHLKNKLDTIKSEHSVFHSVLDNFVTKVTDNVKAVIKVGEINYEKYKELSSSMEHVLNLLIKLRAEIQRPREGCSSINTDDVVETVYSRLSSELTQKDKELHSMLSNQRKEIEENIQRTSDEWYQKYKELTTHLDNLEVEAQNNFQKVSEQQNNTMVQQKRDNELTNSKISEMSSDAQNLQDKVMHLNSTVVANETKMSEEFSKSSELLKSNILELTKIEITKSLKDPTEKIKENSSKVSKVEKKTVELEQRILNSTDVMKRDISETSVKLQSLQKNIAANETKVSEELAKNSEKFKSSLSELTAIEITKRLNDPIQKIKENSSKISKVEKKNVELENHILNSTDVMKHDISETSIALQGFQKTIAANETKITEELAKNCEQLKSSLSELTTKEITKRLNGPIQKIKENSSKISKVEKKNVELEQRLLNSTDVIKRDISEISITLQVFEKRLDTGSSTLAPQKQISAINDAQIKKTNSELSSESRKNTTKQMKTSPDKSEEKEQATSNEQDMRHVADSLKPPEDSSAAVPVENQTSLGSVPTTATQPSQQYQQPPQQLDLSAQPQGGRLPRPPQLQSPVMYNPAYQGNNVIIVPNMYAAPSYQRVPLYQPNPAPNYAAGNIMYFQNGWPNQPLQQTAAPFEPQQRKRKVLEITDPNTGRTITEKLFNKSHTNEADEHHEEPPAATSNEQNMRKQVTRLVADRLKPPEDSSAAVPKTMSE